MLGVTVGVTIFPFEPSYGSMTNPDTHTLESALSLIREHGDQAPIYAAMEADRLAEAGDLDGAAHWRHVLRAIRRMVEPEAARQ